MLLCCCSSNNDEFSSFKEVNGSGWVFNNPLVFVPEHQDSIISGPLLLTVRHNDSYPFANLWLVISDDTHTDTLNIKMADIYGNWAGKGLGSTKEITLTVNENYTHHSGDTIRIRHIVRTDTLQGVSMVGLQLNPQNI